MLVGFGSFAVVAVVSFCLVVGLVLVVFLRLGFGLLRVRWFRLFFSHCSAPRVGRPRPKLKSLRSKLAVFK